MSQPSKLQMQRDEFMAVLDFILNKCDVRQIDAIEAAVIRRKKNLGSLSGLTSSDPSKMASEMTASINKSIASSIDGMTDSIRDYALGIISKEAPELSEEQKEELLNAWVPKKRSDPKKNNKTSRKSKISGTVLESMALQFVADCIGSLDPEISEDLKEELPTWRKSYWSNFPSEIQALIQARLSGDLTDVEFEATLSLLCSQ